MVVAATSDITIVVGKRVWVTVLVLVGVGTLRHEQAKETAVGNKFFRHAGVGIPGTGLLIEVDIWRFSRALELRQVVIVVASAVSVTVLRGAVMGSRVTVGRVDVAAVAVSVPVVLIVISVK